jgi:hypothetical protein
MLHSDEAFLWAASVAAFAAGALAWFVTPRFRGTSWILIVLLGIVLMLWARFATGPSQRVLPVFILAATALAWPRLVGSRSAGYWAAAIGCVAVFVAGLTMGGSLGWLKVGFLYAEYHYPAMNMGAASNLASILAHPPYGYALDSPTFAPTFLGIEEPLTVRMLMRSIYAILLVLCAAGAALNTRRGSARTLIALSAPWVLFFAILPQMHERYLLWGAALTSVTIACGMGPTLLHLVVTALAFLPTFQSMLSTNSPWSPKWLDFVSRTHPGIGWMVLATAAIWLFLAVMPAPRSVSGVR